MAALGAVDVVIPDPIPFFDDRGLIAERVAGVNGRRSPLPPEVVHGDRHRARSARRVDALDLDADPPALGQQQQVELGAVVGRPEVDVIRRGLGNHLLEDEPLPGSADARVHLQGIHRPDADQMVVEAGVPDVDLGPLDLPFAKIGLARPRNGTGSLNGAGWRAFRIIRRRTASPS